ncbi:MAG TPA: GAF domain-containing protein, partial [Candidatus Dormibacteraeota bacterium]
MAKTAAPATSVPTNLRQDLVTALRTCATEADVVQVLYQALHQRFGYDVVVLHVLEREGWYHHVAVDQGILQDTRRRRLVDSQWAEFYKRGLPEIIYPLAPEGVSERMALEPSRGLGARKTPQTVLFVPFEHRREITGAVLYQTHEWRDVPAEELEFLQEIHRQLGVVVANAYLNELTRNQAVRLTALNTIARALASTLDEEGVVAALHRSLGPMLPLDRVQLVVPDEINPGFVHVLRNIGGRTTRTRLSARSERLPVARRVLESAQPVLRADGDDAALASVVAVPIVEGREVRAVLSIHSAVPHTYEESTVTFLTQVADEVALAIRNAASYTALQAERRRLEVVNAVGRRLASSLDRWSIMRTLREELARHLHFDGFALATITEAAEGPMAEGYTYMSGAEHNVYTVPLAAAGPSREAYETGRPVLVRRSRWARSIEAQHPSGERLVRGEGAAIYVGEGSGDGRLASRSLVWVPVRHGEVISALLSLQSYRAEAFNDWHVQLLQDVAAHVSLALANAEHFAAAQTERRRLEALHVLEMGVAGSGDEREIAEAVFDAAAAYIENASLSLLYLDPEGQMIGFGRDLEGGVAAFDPRAIDETVYFRRVQESGATLIEEVLEEGETPIWGIPGERRPTHVVLAPIVQDGRVVAAISSQRFEEKPFAPEDVALLESAAPVVGIALRTVRLHRANEMALAHSVRMQEVAGLAGHDLDTVVRSIAEQSRTMLAATGAACWAIDLDGRFTAVAASGDDTALQVVHWAGMPDSGTWHEAPREALTGSHSGVDWTLIPLWYANVLVGALGSVHPGGRPEQSGSGPVDFARHAAIAIENSRLAAETRDRIRTLEAVAAFTEIDITQPERTREEMALLIERALAASRGSLWLLDGDELVHVRGEERLVLGDREQILRDLRGEELPARVRALLASAGRGQQAAVAPILVDGRLGGLVVAYEPAGSPAETRRLMSVLAGQAGVVLGRLRLVDALDRERRMMNTILRASPVGIILEDPDGQVVYANPEAELLYGVTSESMTGRGVDLILEEAGAEVQQVDPEAEPGAPLVLRLSNPDRVVEVRRVSIPSLAQEPAGVLTLHEDVTEERQMLEAKDLMLRAIGHEVRSPAAAMRSTLAGILQWEKVMEADQRTALLNEAYEMSDRLLSLVEGQLIVAKLETRRFEPNPARVAITTSMEHVMAVLRHRYGDRADRVDFTLPEQLPSAFCEPTHLDQVLTNLIGNALEYTTAPVHVSAHDVDAGWLEVTVADEGQGLPPERVESLFRKTGPAGQNR